MKTSVESLKARTPASGLGLSAEQLSALVERALEEDLGEGDLTARWTVPEGKKARGSVISQQALVVAGLPVAAEVFRRVDSAVEWEEKTEEGSEVEAGATLAVARGPAAALLAAERVALNFLQRMSGTATLTRHLKKQLEGLKTELLDTRKTTPGLRALEKYAVRVGGGHNHRFGLFDGVLIKRNHARLAGGVRPAVESAIRRRSGAREHLAIEVEVRNLAELEEALAAGAEAALLDNMTVSAVRECVGRARGRVRLEVSGGVNEGNIRAFAETGVDAISVGALTHSAPAVAIHFLVEPAP